MTAKGRQIAVELSLRYRLASFLLLCCVEWIIYGPARQLRFCTEALGIPWIQDPSATGESSKRRRTYEAFKTCCQLLYPRFAPDSFVPLLYNPLGLARDSGIPGFCLALDWPHDRFQTRSKNVRTFHLFVCTYSQEECEKLFQLSWNLSSSPSLVLLCTIKTSTNRVVARYIVHPEPKILGHLQKMKLLQFHKFLSKLVTSSSARYIYSLHYGCNNINFAQES